MFSILLAKVGFICGNMPINAKASIQDTDATINLRMVEFITLILENSGLTQHCETVGKTTRHKELAMVIFRQL